MSAELLSRLRAQHPVGELIHLDFETYYSSDYSLSKLTTEAYVRDERFEVIGVGVQIGRNGQRVWLEAWDFVAWARKVDWSRVAVSAHHAQFDGFILSERYGIRPGFITCTMSMGRALYGEGGLQKLALRHGLGAKGDDIESGKTKGKRRADFTQAEWESFGEYCKQDVKLAAELLYLMKPQLPALELWLLDTTIRMFTEPVFTADAAVLQKALVEERAKKRALLERVAAWATAGEKPNSKKPAPDPVELARKVLGSSDKFAALLRSLGEDPPTKFNAKGETTYAFAKTDPGMQDLLESDREEIRQLAEARLSVKSTIIETRVERMIGIHRRGAVPFYLKFCGAHTHRWSGGDKMNPQNFNRGGSLRDAVLAFLGWLLVVVDSGQIEARVNAWFAGETKTLEAFRRNDLKTDAYLAAFATEVAALGREPTAAEAKAITRALAARGIEEGDFYSDEGAQFFNQKLSKAETPSERQISKALILGLGFSMGWEKCAGELLKGMLGTPPVQFVAADAQRFGVDVAAFEVAPFGREGETCGDIVRGMISKGARLPYADLLIHAAVSAHFVRRYRATNRRISNTWRSCESVLEVMAREGGDPNEVRMMFGCLKVIYQGLVKPNGMVLRYPGLRKTSGGFVYKGGKSGREWTKVYGGLLTENIVQSLARDIVAEQVMRIRADGFKIGTTTHDEAVAVVPEDQGAAAYKCAVKHFRTPPAWCADLPLNAEGGVSRRYGDAK